MAFGAANVDHFEAFRAKYDLVAGFGGNYDLLSLFGDLVNDTSFVRDRVSLFISSLYDHNPCYSCVH